MVVIHEGTANGIQHRRRQPPPSRGTGRSSTIAEELADTTVDAIVAGHTHRVSNLMVGNILVTEGINAGASYSVLQLMVVGGDVQWAGGATRIAKNLGVAPRADVKAIVDDANAETAVLRNEVIGTQAADIRRDPTRLERVADGQLRRRRHAGEVPGAVDAAITNSGGLRADLVFTPPPAGEAARRDHLGRGVRGAAVRQPHGDPHPDRARSSSRRSSTGSARSATRRSRPVGSRRSPG